MDYQKMVLKIIEDNKVCSYKQILSLTKEYGEEIKSANFLNNILSNLKKDKQIINIIKGFYCSVDSYLDNKLIDEFIIEHFISSGESHYGYYTGLSLLNLYSNITQQAALIEIVSKYETKYDVMGYRFYNYGSNLLDDTLINNINIKYYAEYLELIKMGDKYELKTKEIYSATLNFAKVNNIELKKLKDGYNDIVKFKYVREYKYIQKVERILNEVIQEER